VCQPLKDGRKVRYVAFLRAINVGGHTVAMDRLRRLFEGLGLAGVETFIASGNVIFSTRSKDAAALENRIEAHLEKALGYQVKTFVRTDAEVARIAAYQPFAAARMKTAGALQVGLLQAPPVAEGANAFLAMRCKTDDFHVNDREVYWMCETRQSASRYFGVKFDKVLKAPVTFRGLSTMIKLSAKYPPSMP
jgi:uncharacterized protein (DUF1697 family)